MSLVVTRSGKGIFNAPTDLVRSVMDSPLQVLIGMYLLIGLDDIGLLCMLLAYLGVHSPRFFDSVHARLAGPRVPSGKCSASFGEGPKAVKDKRSAPQQPPHALLVASVVLLGGVRLVGPSLQLVDTRASADVVLVVLVAFAYFQSRKTQKISEKSAPHAARNANKVISVQPPSAATRHCKSSRGSSSEKLGVTARHDKTSARSPSELPSATSRRSKGSLGQSSTPIKETASKTYHAVAPAASGLAGEIERFVMRSLPREEDDVLLRRLTAKAKSCLQKVVPEADVTTVAYMNLAAEEAEGEVHDTDCHTVVTCDPDILAARLKEYFLKVDSGRRKNTDKLTGPELRKCATKALAQRLNFLMFWRSQFSGLDPMVVYMVPDNLSGHRKRIRLHFIVNCPCHLRLATVISQEDTRTKQLVIFMVEWAKRRALVNVTKGLAHPYAWCLLALHFLRFQADEAETLMGTIRDFVKYLIQALGSDNGPIPMCFTSEGHAASRDAACKLWGLPYIEDPWDTTLNVAGSVSTDGLARIRVELARADGILSKDSASLSDLFERYYGPVAQPTEDE